MREYQRALHRWGLANGVPFDSGKESMHIISRSQGTAPEFKFLGTCFDTKLVMQGAAHECAVQCAWRLRVLLRTQRFYNDAELVLMYKSHILSYLEFRTASLSHASTSVLSELDGLHDRFLRSVGLTEIEALMHFKLAPLALRRDIAILGVIHRCALRLGPKCLWKFFVLDDSEVPARAPRRHARHLRGPCHLRCPDYALRSALGGARLYNLLPDYIVSASSVRLFQSRLTRDAR